MERVSVRFGLRNFRKGTEYGWIVSCPLCGFNFLFRTTQWAFAVKLADRHVDALTHQIRMLKRIA